MKQHEPNKAKRSASKPKPTPNPKMKTAAEALQCKHGTDPSSAVNGTKNSASSATTPKPKALALRYGANTFSAVNEAKNSASSATTHKPNGDFAAGNPYAFRPGQSGNPNGRPPHPDKHPYRFMSRRLIESLHCPYPDDPHGRSYFEVGIDRVVEDMGAGDRSALALVYDRMEGSPRQNVETNPGFDSQRWIRIATELLAALEPYPEAKGAVLIALDKIEAQDEQEDEQQNAGF